MSTALLLFALFLSLSVIENRFAVTFRPAIQKGVWFLLKHKYVHADWSHDQDNNEAAGSYLRVKVRIVADISSSDLVLVTIT